MKQITELIFLEINRYAHMFGITSSDVDDFNEIRTHSGYTNFFSLLHFCPSRHIKSDCIENH